MDRREQGAFGEQAAEHYLLKHRYKILDRNYFCRFGEIDIIAEKKGFLAFVEVKTRAEDARYTPREAVDAFKQGRIIKTAQYYLYHNRAELQPRFDVIEVVTEKDRPDKVRSINHIENAFTL